MVICPQTILAQPLSPSKDSSMGLARTCLGLNTQQHLAIVLLRSINRPLPCSPRFWFALLTRFWQHCCRVAVPIVPGQRAPGRAHQMTILNFYRRRWTPLGGGRASHWGRRHPRGRVPLRFAMSTTQQLPWRRPLPCTRCWDNGRRRPSPMTARQCLWLPSRCTRCPAPIPCRACVPPSLSCPKFGRQEGWRGGWE